MWCMSPRAAVAITCASVIFKGCDVHIIEVEPSARGQGLGSQLLLAAVETLRGLEAKYVHVECTSAKGEALCRRHGFETYVDPNSYRSESGTLLLRLYLSEWRPRPPNSRA